MHAHDARERALAQRQFPVRLETEKEDLSGLVGREGEARPQARQPRGAVRDLRIIMRRERDEARPQRIVVAVFRAAFGQEGGRLAVEALQGIFQCLHRPASLEITVTIPASTCWFAGYSIFET